MNEIISHISFITVLCFLNLTGLVLFIHYKKYGKLLLMSILLMLLIITHMLIFFNEKLSLVIKEKDYNLSSSSVKYHSRINLHKRVFLLRDSFLDNKDILGVNLGQKSSVEHLFYLTRFQNSEFFASPELQSHDLYYQMCLFYSNNNCNHFVGFNNGPVYKIDTTDLRLQSNNIELLPLDLKYLVIPENKQELIILNYQLGRFLNTKNLSCLNLFYGAQNKWNSYRDELIDRLKNDKNDICLDNILNKFEADKNEQTKLTLINFLNNFKDQDNLDFEIESGKISLKEAYQRNKISNDSIYSELLNFIYENKKINNTENMIIQLSYLKFIINVYDLLNTKQKQELIDLIKKYPEPNLQELKVYEMNFIDQKYQLLDYLKGKKVEPLNVII